MTPPATDDELCREPIRVAERLADLPLAAVVVLPTADSTNDVARSKLQGANPVLVLADSQSHGRGRGGRRWESPPGGLWFSLGLREGRGEISLVPILAGVAVAEGLRAMAFDARVKWPNDVLVDGEKVAGVLVEAAACGERTELVVGIGVNVNLCPHRLQEKVVGARVGSLMAVAGQPVSRVEVLVQVLTVFFRMWPLWRSGQTGSIVQRWRELSATLGQQVTVSGRGGQIVGVAEDLAPDGSLLVRDAAGLLERVVDGQIVAQDAATT